MTPEAKAILRIARWGGAIFLIICVVGTTAMPALGPVAQAFKWAGAAVIAAGAALVLAHLLVPGFRPVLAKGWIVWPVAVICLFAGLLITGAGDPYADAAAQTQGFADMAQYTDAHEAGFTKQAPYLASLEKVRARKTVAEKAATDKRDSDKVSSKLGLADGVHSVAAEAVAQAHVNGGSTAQAKRSPVHLPAKLVLKITPDALDDHRVQFTITTNLPMPIKVAAGIELHGQKGDDIFIGYNEFLSLSGPETVVVLDTAKADRPLPSGLYDAVVDFYPDWGAKKNPVAAKAPRLHAVRQFHLVGDGGSAAAAKLKDKRQFWVMGHVYTDMPWNRAKFVKRLGKAVRGRSNMSSRIVAYYFAGPDMTILVNSLNNKVTTWVKGNAIVRPNATKKNFETRGLTWPLTVDRGYLGCQGSAVWFETLNGHTYAVNGIARSSYPPIDPVWATDRKTLAQLKGMGVRVEIVPKINIGDLIAEGLRHC